MVDKPEPEAQADNFRDLARELECDEDEEAFRGEGTVDRYGAEA